MPTKDFDNRVEEILSEQLGDDQWERVHPESGELRLERPDGSPTTMDYLARISEHQEEALRKAFGILPPSNPNASPKLDSKEFEETRKRIRAIEEKADKRIRAIEKARANSET